MIGAPAVASTLRLDCACGERITGNDEDDLVEKVQAHLAEAHPDKVGEYTRDQILTLAF
jgi:hypothetical protein